MSALEIAGGRRLAGRVALPPDKSISHRALILGALGRGQTTIHPLSRGGDNTSTLKLLAALGVDIAIDGETATVRGVAHPWGFRPPGRPLDCENSGTTMRVMTGVLAGAAGRFELTGDESLTRRPMGRLRPLEAMGARITGRPEGGKLYPPLVVEGSRLVGVEHTLEIASAQVKTALLLAGLYASGRTIVKEPLRSRDHTERMLGKLGVAIGHRPDGAIEVEPLTGPLEPGHIEVPGDVSSAAFLLAAAVLTDSPALEVECGTNPTRTGIVDALRALGAVVEVEPLGESLGEPSGRIRARPGPRGLVGATIDGELALRALDEIPVLAVVAAFAEGTTRFRDVDELRVKESDRLVAIVELLSAFGGEARLVDGGLDVIGRPEGLRAARFDGGRDHRIAMSAAVLALAVSGRSTVEGAEIIRVSYPSFVSELVRIGAEVSEAGGTGGAH